MTLRRDVGNYLVYYLEENQDRFPGVSVQRVFVRHYPHGTLAAHILGSVGEVDRRRAEGAALPRASKPGDEVGQDGVEYTYDRYLRGKPGLTKIQVDALGAADPGRPARLAAAGARRQPEADDRPRRPGSRRSGARGAAACRAPS